jgi:hypothetical protein
MNPETVIVHIHVSWMTGGLRPAVWIPDSNCPATRCARGVAGNEGRCPAQGPLRCVHLPSLSVPTGCPPPQIVVKAGGGHLSVHQIRAVPRPAACAPATGSWSNGSRMAAPPSTTCGAIPARSATARARSRSRPDGCIRRCGAGVPRWRRGCRSRTPTTMTCWPGGSRVRTATVVSRHHSHHADRSGSDLQAGSRRAQGVAGRISTGPSPVRSSSDWSRTRRRCRSPAWAESVTRLVRWCGSV